MANALFLILAIGVVLGQTPPRPLRVSMISLGVKDAARSVKFYGEILGLELVGKPGEVTLFRAGDITIALNRPLWIAAGNSIVGAVEVIFPVDSVAASYHSLAGRDCSFTKAPHEVAPGMWAATFTDPDGHRLTILGAR
jgi:catechol 2,3-dioxygenase-like lactoylglutathione lyase family enzyme